MVVLVVKKEESVWLQFKQFASFWPPPFGDKDKLVIYCDQVSQNLGLHDTLLPVQMNA